MIMMKQYRHSVQLFLMSGPNHPSAQFAAGGRNEPSALPASRLRAACRVQPLQTANKVWHSEAGFDERFDC